MAKGGLIQAFLENRVDIARFLAARGVAPTDIEDLLQELYLKVS